MTITNNTGKIEKYIDMTHCGMELEWHPLALAPFLLRYTFYQKSWNNALFTIHVPIYFTNAALQS